MTIRTAQRVIVDTLVAALALGLNDLAVKTIKQNFDVLSEWF